MKTLGALKNQGAYHYSREIVENIIPKVATARPWVTVNIPGRCYDHAIVFIHNNLNPSWYKWLNNYEDLVLVCGMPWTAEDMRKICPKHHVIYLPLSVDVDYVERFKVKKKTKKTAFAGRLAKLDESILEERRDIPDGIDILGDIPREELLKAMAQYKTIYAVGRTAIEAKVLGCKVKSYNSLCPDPDFWEVYDNSEAALILQEKLDIIDEKEAKNASKKSRGK